MTRRTAIVALGASAWLASEGGAQTTAERNSGGQPNSPEAARTVPLLCAYSQNLAKISYAELGLIVQQIGYDGVDLTVRQGGHVSPDVLNVDLVRAIESIRGADLELPMITTDIASPADPAAYPILAITGHTSVHMYRLGYWPYGQGNPARRLAEIRGQLGSLVGLGQRCDMVALLPNRAGGYFGESIWDAQSVLNELDPRWIGYCYDPSQAVAAGNSTGWEVGLRLALPRLKAVALQDFVWTKNGDQWRVEKCPLGEGMVDWSRFFRVLAEAKFAGPMTLHLEYQAQDQPGAMKKDLEFARAQVAKFWPEGATKRSS